MSKKQASIVDELRQAIRKAERGGMTRYKLAKVTGMPRSQVSRIADGENAPRLDTAQNILAALGKRLTIVPK